FIPFIHILSKDVYAHIARHRHGQLINMFFLASSCYNLHPVTQKKTVKDKNQCNIRQSDTTPNNSKGVGLVRSRDTHCSATRQ
ncbi:hypothetical protein, partial [Brenneria goodwinii]